MNIPMKYEDVVAKLDAAEVIIQAGEHVESHLEKQIDILRIDLDAALGREAALREKLAYEESDHHTTQVSRDAWREKYEDALKVIQEKDLLLNRSQDFVAFVHKCVRKNKEYAPLHWQEMVELDRDLSALKSAEPAVEIPVCDEDEERSLYEAFYIERAKTLPLPLGNSPLRYAGGQYINDFALFGWMVWLSRAQSRAGSGGQ